MLIAQFYEKGTNFCTSDWFSWLPSEMHNNKNEVKMHLTSAPNDPFESISLWDALPSPTDDLFQIFSALHVTNECTPTQNSRNLKVHFFLQ